MVEKSIQDICRDDYLWVVSSHRWQKPFGLIEFTKAGYTRSGSGTEMNSKVKKTAPERKNVSRMDNLIRHFRCILELEIAPGRWFKRRVRDRWR